MKGEQRLRRVVPLNQMPDGTARTVKSQYYKNGFVNFFIQGSYGATGVLDITDQCDA